MDALELSANLSSFVESREGFNNQAVLGALGSLQQKIKRLEQERDYYMEASQKARRHVESFKAESESLREQERRQIEERQRHTEEELRKLKEERPRLEMELRHTRDKLLHTERLLEAERKDYAERIEEVTALRDQLKEEAASHHRRVQQLEAQAEEDRRSKHDSFEEKEKTRSNVSALVHLNEMLFARIKEMEKPSPRGRVGSVSRPALRRSCSASVDRHTVSSGKRVRAPNKLSIHEKLKRINQGEIPFVPAGRSVGGDSFNQMARVQTGLDVSAPPPRSSTPPKRYVIKAPHVSGQHDIEDVHKRFQREYDTINRRYAEELDKLRHSGDPDVRVVDRLRCLAEELQAKGDDLKTLTEHETKLHEHYQEIMRPPHIRGLNKRVKTLELFEEMKRVHAMIA